MSRAARRRASAAEACGTIEDLTPGGDGILRHDGKVAFIPGALPGETVRWRLRRRRRRVDEGELLSVDRAAADRVAPRCAHFGTCGGCRLQHLSATGQLRTKQKHLLDALERIGRVSPGAVAPPVTGPPWGYRRRARLAVKYVPKKGGVLVGFRERRAPYVAQLSGCETLDPRVGGQLTDLAAVIGRLSIRDRLPQVEVATSDEHAVLVLRVLDPPSDADRVELRAFERESGLRLCLQPAGLESVAPLTPPLPSLHYSPDGHCTVRFAPTDFVQVNDAVNRTMVAQAQDWLDLRPGLRVLELFSGLGNFSLPMARRGAAVTAVEGDPGLVDRARENAAAQGLASRHVLADLSAPSGDWLAKSYDVLLLDPPRTGAAEALAALDPLPRRILYVSCHPGTLARDAGTLVHHRRLRLSRVGVLDMFPHTAHVEAMALFEPAA